jgi:cation diffusion facilitator CzcD-associated flavoprotein CzcO
METKKVLVIGAGPSGLSQLRAFVANKSLKVVCIEKQPEWGGIWVNKIHLKYRTLNGELEQINMDCPYILPCILRC